MVLCLLIPLFCLSAFATDTPADYQFTEVKESSISGSLKGISNDPFSALQWNLKTIGMEEAWRSGLTGKGVVVAIVDSGLSDMTLDIDKSRILPGKNCVGGTGVTDTIGHGTFIAGIIGATKDNLVGVAGIAPGVTIAPIKSYASSETDFAAQAAGIYAAVDEYHCDILNISAGDPEIVPEVQAAIAGIQTFITEHYYNCTKQIFAGLGQMYAADERFKANIDRAGGEGTAEFVSSAIEIYCK
jgi:subtilisin family serine protease